MDKLKTFIVDDEHSARDLLKELLSGESWIEITGEAGTVELAIPEIIRTHPDVILLDIQMPREDGFELVEKLLFHEIDVEVIFITAYERYAIRAIKAAAFDYLLKPVRKSELITSLAKVRNKVDTSHTKGQFRELMHVIESRRKIMFKNRTGFVIVDPEEIIYCKADSNYTIMELDSGKSMVISMNLGKVEKLLPEDSFCRVSRSVIIQVHYLAQVDKKNLKLHLANSSIHVVSVSRKFLTKLEECCNTIYSNNREHRQA